MTTAAIIGCGAISQQHLNYLVPSTRVDLVGVCDLSPAVARFTAERAGCAAYTDHRDMLAAERPDVVHVLTPPASHRQLALDALENGAHVVVEKPAVGTAKELDELLAVAAETGRLLIENQNYRWNEEVTWLESLIAAGRVGDLVAVDVSMALALAGGPLDDPNLPNPVGHLAGGAIRDFLPHLAGLALHLSGDRPYSAVAARWRNNSGSEKLGCDELRAAFDVGPVRCSVTFDARVAPEHFEIAIGGTAGSARVDLFQPHRLLHVPTGPQVLSPLLNHLRNGAGLIGASVGGLRNKVMQHLPYHGVPRLLEAFYEAVEHDAAPPLSPDALVLTARLVDDMAELVP